MKVAHYQLSPDSMEGQKSVEAAVSLWLDAHCIGRKPTTVKFNSEIARAIRENWHDLNQLCDTITTPQVLLFAQKVAHYCPSRWNAIISALQCITAKARVLRRRPLKLRHFVPPSQIEFEALLRECDAAGQESKAGLFIRFFSMTGLRYAEGQRLKWCNVFSDRIEVPAEISKNGKCRVVPMLGGLDVVLVRLRQITGNTDFVLPRENAKKAIRSAARRAGLKNWSYHFCRHYYATRCIQCGVDVPTVARWLGHSDGGALLGRVYFHLQDEHSRRMAERVQIAA